jgi:acyl carrier protein
VEELIAILEEIHPDVDYENCTTLIDDEILSSFDVISIVGELEDTYDIRILPVEVVPANFNSAKAIYAMVERLRG